MAHLTVAEYDALEGAIREGRRIVVHHRRQHVAVVPLRLVLRNRREAIEARHPTTGEVITIWIDEADRFEVVR